ncbi:MAG: 4Fe-4S binding protein [Alteromonadaceae bacterium]|nr:4Fe-4S binding protein [Alteromonadaceae bacterium]
MRNIFILIALLMWFIFPVRGENATDVPPDIADLFPTATRVAPPDTDIPVIPVFQLSQLLGYVFESKDFASFMGFAGEPINVLIGLDTQGKLTGLKVIKHNEPIFIHGLGPQPMHDFTAQYVGHSIRERFIIGADDRTGDATYFDGVSKATVSVLVINDTIISAALKVARAKLDGFVAPSNKIVDPKAIVPSSWDELVAGGFIQAWYVNYEDTQDLPSEIKRAIDDIANEGEGNQFIELYTAFLTVEPIGKAILGDQEYARLVENLKPGEQGIFVLSRGDYSVLSDDFRPQTVPKRLNLVQNEFPVSIRDIDFYHYYEPEFAIDLPDYKDLLVLRLKSQTGFEVSMPMQLEFSLDYNPSFMVIAQHDFINEVVLPDSLFMDNPDALVQTPKPLWMTIWEGKTSVIAITVSYLLFITLMFIYQQRLAAHERLIHWSRGAALVFVLFFIGFYAQGQLSVVNIYTLLLALYDGFVIEIFLLDPVIFILWCFVFVSLFLFGRGLYCGWLCPFGALQEFAGMLAKKLHVKQIKITPSTHQRLQYLKYVLLVGIVGSAFYSMSIAEKLAELEPFKTSITLYFVRSWPFVVYAVLLLLLSMKIHKVYCRYLCPLGAGLAVLGAFPLFKLIRRREECGSPCQLCKTKKCDIDAIEKDGSINYRECIQCLECVVTIENPSICVIDKYKGKNKRVVKQGNPIAVEVS